MVVPVGFKAKIYDEKQDGSEKHRDKHLAGCRDADEYTVPNEGTQAGCGNQIGPEMIGAGCRKDIGLVGEQGKEMFATTDIN